MGDGVLGPPRPEPPQGKRAELCPSLLGQTMFP
jgi:hypothetical protein